LSEQVRLSIHDVKCGWNPLCARPFV
jgi:hypothetical protein